MSGVLELFGESVSIGDADWQSIANAQSCPYLDRKCLKIRKSEPEISIGTCSVLHGRRNTPIVICPHRLLERKKIFVDCLHLLRSHEPGNDLHIVREITVPGGTVDYFLTSVNSDKVVDFVGIELQSMDTTGTVWPARQRFLSDAGVAVPEMDEDSRNRRYGMNWKMTAKTIMIQIHHKVQTFESINKYLVLITQDVLMDYLKDNFEFGHVTDARLGDSMQFHSYQFGESADRYALTLSSRSSTDANGVGICLGLRADPNIGREQIIAQLERKLSDSTRLDFL